MERCLVPDFDFYTRLVIAMAAPFAVTLVLVAGCALWIAVCAKKAPAGAGVGAGPRPHTSRSPGWRRSRITAFGKDLAASNLTWTTVAVVLNAVDVMYPVVCRTLLQFFSCRNLGSAGFFVESDFGEACYTERWWAWFPGVAFAAAVFHHLCT